MPGPRPSRPRIRTKTYRRSAVGERSRGTSDRQRGRSGASQTAIQIRAGRGTAEYRRTPTDGHDRLQVVGIGLRAKFMLTMSGVTSVALLILGVVLGVTTHNFLFDQTRHQGIELAKMTAQVGRAVLDSLPEEEPVDQDEVRSRIQTYLDNARTWGDHPPEAYSFVHGIIFENGLLSGLGVGALPNRTMTSRVGITDFDVPGGGTVHLDRLPDIDAYPTTSNVNGRKTPVYRFKVRLNDRSGDGYLPNQAVWVDVGYESIERVKFRLFTIIFAGIVVIAALVMGAASYLAGRITKPVRLLMRDMRAVSKGDLDHRTKPHSNDEIGVLAGEFALMTQNLKEAQAAVIEQEKAAYELSIAREVQQQLLPAQAPSIPGYDPAAFYKGAKAVSGDYYDFIPLGDHQMGFIVADVSGKGVPGSMVMAVTRTLVRLVASKHRKRTAETLKETNRLIAKEIRRGMFVTAFYAVLDTRDGSLTLSSAGHNPMAIYRHASKTVELFGPKGIAIGFNEGPIFDRVIQEYTTTLSPGDAFLLYTDGFPEAMDDQHREFGEEAFFRGIAQSGHLGSAGMIRHLLERITQHRGRAPQSDDLTMIVVRRQL